MGVVDAVHGVHQPGGPATTDFEEDELETWEALEHTGGAQVGGRDDAVGAIDAVVVHAAGRIGGCLLYTSPSPRDRTRSRMPSSA